MLKKISLRELFLLVAIVALFLAWRSAGPALHQLRELQIKTGRIRQESKDVISVLQRESEHGSNWRFEILIPDDANYQYIWTYDLNGSKPLYPPRKVDCSDGYQHSLSVTTMRGTGNQKWAAFGYYGNLGDETIYLDGEIASHLSLENQSALRHDFDASYNYKSRLHEFALGETIQLLRLEGTHPDTGNKLWVELNMVPLSQAEIKERDKMPPLPSGMGMPLMNHEQGSD